MIKKLKLREIYQSPNSRIQRPMENDATIDWIGVHVFKKAKI